MKIAKRFVFVVLLLMMVLSLPSTAMAQTDEYGYNAQARMFLGTLDNWEAFLNGTPPTPFNWDDKGVIFIKRRWDILFDPMIQGNPPSSPGAWEQSESWEYLTGDQLGWTWHLNLAVVYSPETPIPGAIKLTPKDMGFTGFYCVLQEEWLIGPQGERTDIQDFSLESDVINKVLKFKGRKQ